MDPMERETGQPHCPHDPPHAEKPDRWQILDNISVEFPRPANLGCVGSGCFENPENHAQNDPFSANYDMGLVLPEGAPQGRLRRRVLRTI